MNILKSKRFLAYATGLTIDRLGNAIYATVLPLLVYDMSKSLWGMSLTALLQFLPRVILVFFVGAIIDKNSRRLVLFSALIFQFLCSLAIYLLYSNNALEIWMVYLIGVLVSIGFEFSRTAEIAVVPIMFKEDLIRATSILGSCFSAMFVFGPALSGMLISIIPFGTLFLLNSFTYLAPILFSYWSKIPSYAKVNKKTSYSQMILEGISYFWNNPILKYLFLIVFISGVGTGGFQTLVIYYLKKNIGYSDSTVAIVLAFNGLGLLVSSILVSNTDKKYLKPTIYGGFVVCLISVLLFYSSSFYVLIVAQFLMAAGGFSQRISQDIIVQMVVPENLMGRVSGFMRLNSHITFSLSTAILAWVVNESSIYYAFAFVVLCLLLSFLMSVFSPFFKESIVSNNA